MPQDIMEIIESVDVSWPKDYIIRYLYVKLAPCFQRDLNFFLASYEEKLSQFKEGFHDRGTKIVCGTLVDYYLKILNIFDIETKKIIATNAEIPLFALIVHGDRGWYYLDPLTDLFNNQYGLQTRFFGRTPRYKEVRDNYPNLVQFSYDTLRQMDSELNILKGNLYTSDIFDILRREMITRSIASKILDVDIADSHSLTKKKLQIINDNLINLGRIPGLYERSYMYGFIRGHIFDRIEKTNTEVVFNLDDPTNISLNFIIDYPDYEREVYGEFTDDRGQYFLSRIK